MSNPLPPFQAHSPESREAAVAVVPRTPTIRDRVLACIREWGPISDEGITLVLDLDGSTARPRRVELVRVGLVEKSSEIGYTQARRKCALWRAVVE